MFKAFPLARFSKTKEMAEQTACSQLQLDDLTELDKIYVILAENNLADCFNVLCYDLGIHTFEDWRNLDENALKRFRLLPQFAKGQLKLLAFKAKKSNFVTLALKHGKLPYKAKLQSSGVPFISVNEIQVVKKTASGPVSGSVFEAMWNKPNGEQVKVCLRYDRSLAQRKHFIHEAQMSSSLNHENILHLHGVVLPGLYTDSVALVVDYAACGNLLESIPQQSVSSLFQSVTQLASALEYLQSKNMIHFKVLSTSIFVEKPGKIKLGGMWGCYHRDQVDNQNQGKHFKSELSAEKEMVFRFGQIAKESFRNLEFTQKYRTFTTQEKVLNNALCPKALRNLFDQCCAKVTKKRPSFSHVTKTLSDFSLTKLVVTAEFKAESSNELSCKEGEVILLISETISSELKAGGRSWVGEKRNGVVGLFDPKYTNEVVDVEDVVWDAPSVGEEDEEPASGADQTEREKSSSVPPEIQARGIEAELAFQRALKQGKVRVYRGRVMLVGQNRAGKTSLKKSLLGITFDPGEPSTDGIEVDPSRFDVDVDRVVNWQLVKNEKFTSEFADDIARLVVGELTRKEAKEEKPAMNRANDIVQSDVSADEARHSTEEQLPIQAVGVLTQEDNPPDPCSDVLPSDIPDLIPDPEFHIEIDTSDGVPEDVKILVHKYLERQQSVQEISDRETVVTIWDFAGQHLYYASHPVFLSPRAVYLLVYNMSKDLSAKMEPCVRQGVHDFIPHSSGEETNLDSILSWLVSVHNLTAEGRAKEEEQGDDPPYLRPPVIIVGTHVDEPFEDPKRMETQIKKSLSGKTYEQHVRRPFYRVNNTRAGEDEGIAKVRQEIREVLRLEPYMGEDVPVRWFNFEKVVEGLVQQKVFYLKVAQLYNIVRKVCYIEDESEMVAMLDFYHDLGVIIWHGDSVVLQTQWLIHLFKKLITIRPFDEQNPRHAEAWNELEQTGLLSMRLVQHVFAEFLCDGQSQTDILSMMEMYGLIAKFTPKITDSSLSPDVKYFVPAQLCSCPELDDLDKLACSICPLYILFPDGFLPHGLFPQLVSRLISICSELGCTEEPNLFRNLVRFMLGGNDLFLICKQSFVKVIIVEKETDQQGNEVACKVRERLESVLCNLANDFACLRHMRYEFCVVCPSCSSPSKACTKHRVQLCPLSDCMHFLPISKAGKLICRKTFGASSLVEVPGLEEWRGSSKKINDLDVPDASSVKKDEEIVLEKRNIPVNPPERPGPAVFISYQWDHQETVKCLKSKLEEAGFDCWLDIGRMGGGDSMFAEIDAGIRAAKVVLCCVTERYCKSEMCQREVTLADSLRKPIIPVLLEFIKWPPSGQLALIFTKLLYIDMSVDPGTFPEGKLQELFLKIKGHVEQ